MSLTGAIAMTNGTDHIAFGQLGFKFFIRTGSKGSQISGLFGGIPMIKVELVCVFFMTLEVERTRKTFAGTGTDLAIHLGFLQTFRSTTILQFGNVSQTIDAMPACTMK
jgi:hypothetical protein